MNQPFPGQPERPLRWRIRHALADLGINQRQIVAAWSLTRTEPLTEIAFSRKCSGVRRWHPLEAEAMSRITGIPLTAFKPMIIRDMRRSIAYTSPPVSSIEAIRAMPSERHSS